MQDIPDGCLISVPFRPPLRHRYADFGPQPSEAPLRGDARDSRSIGGGLRGDARDSRPIGGGLRGDVIDFSGGRGPPAEMTSSPQSLADSALGAEGDFSTSPDQKEFREGEKNRTIFLVHRFLIFNFVDITRKIVLREWPGNECI